MRGYQLIWRTSHLLRSFRISLFRSSSRTTFKWWRENLVSTKRSLKMAHLLLFRCKMRWDYLISVSKALLRISLVIMHLLTQMDTLLLLIYLQVRHKSMIIWNFQQKRKNLFNLRVNYSEKQLRESLKDIGTAYSEKNSIVCFFYFYLY